MAILFVQGFWNFLIVRRYFNEWVPVVHYHQLLVSRKRVLFWERPKVFTTWANESRFLRNKVLNREEKNDFRLRDYTDISMTILEHFYFPHGRRGFQASSSFPLSFKMFCQMERLESFSSMHAWKYTQRHPVSFHLIMCRVLKLLKPYSYTGSNAKRYAQEWYPFEQTTCDQ